MKRAILILVIGLFWCSVGFAGSGVKLLAGDGTGTGYQAVEIKYKQLFPHPKSKKPKKAKLTLKMEGMFDNKTLYSNGKQTILFKNKRYKNKKGVASQVEYSIKRSPMACGEYIGGRYKNQGGMCSGMSIVYLENYFADPGIFFIMDYYEGLIKQECPKIKSSKQKAHCLETLRLLTKGLDENHLTEGKLVFEDKNKKGLFHVIIKHYWFDNKPFREFVLEAVLQVTKEDQKKIGKYNYTQMNVKQQTTSAFYQISFETTGVKITDLNEIKVIEDVISSIKSLSSLKILEPKLDTELEKKIFSIMASAEKRLAPGRLYLQRRQ